MSTGQRLRAVFDASEESWTPQEWFRGRLPIRWGASSYSASLRQLGRQIRLTLPWCLGGALSVSRIGITTALHCRTSKIRDKSILRASITLVVPTLAWSLISSLAQIRG